MNNCFIFLLVLMAILMWNYWVWLVRIIAPSNLVASICKRSRMNFPFIAWFCRKTRSKFPFDYLKTNDKLRLGSTQASVDLNNDLVAGLYNTHSNQSRNVSWLDLFLTIDTDDGMKFRIYELPITKLTLIKEYDPPSDVALYHLSTFADIGRNCRWFIRFDSIDL